MKNLLQVFCALLPVLLSTAPHASAQYRFTPASSASLPSVPDPVSEPAAVPVSQPAAAPAPWSSSSFSMARLSADAFPDPLFPRAAAPAHGPDEPIEPYPEKFYRAPWSRASLGADLSPLGVGLKATVVLNTYLDGRLMGNFFNYTNGRFETDGFNIYAKFHFASAAAALDFYPWHSVWRLSVGTMFLNGNNLSANLITAPGTSIDLGNGHTFFSAKPDPVTGMTPVTGHVKLGLNRTTPALTLSGGFGNYIARANHHWTFPTEFGVILTGSPTLDVNLTGWACLDPRQTQCSDIGDPANPVAIDFNNALTDRLNRIRRSLNDVQIYPIFSYGVVYTFNTPW